MKSPVSKSCAPGCGCGTHLTRRDFLKWTSLAAAASSALPWHAVAGPFTDADFERLVPSDKKLDPDWVKSLFERGTPTVYRGAELEKIGMPVGGTCAGQLYLGGDGRLWHWDIFNQPQPRNFSDTGGPNYARPPKPASPIDQGFALKVTSGGRAHVRTLDSRGFDPRHTSFQGQYPVGRVEYQDPSLPVVVSLEAFSPFIPLNVEDSSLPATVMRYKVRNTGTAKATVEIAGWLQNAVCISVERAELGQRRNRLEKSRGIVLVHSTAEKQPSADRPHPRPEIIFETFEEGYGDWKTDGEAFGTEPAKGTLSGQQSVSGFTGERLVNSFFKGDTTTGRLTSPVFAIERKFIAFRIGGGSHAGRTCVNLLLDGKPVRTATGHNEEKLEWTEWDVAEFEGRQARVEIVDQSTEGWGHINVDEIVFTDAPPSDRVPLEEREDYGSMCLAVLNADGNSYAKARIAAEPADALFSENPADAREAVTPFGRKLVGAAGKKLILKPGAEGEVVFAITWYFPGLLRSTLGPIQDVAKLKRAYANRFKSAEEVARYVGKHFERLDGETRLWNQTWYDSTLPYWFLDRTFAPICTLATSTCYQFDNGRFYAFEGVYCCQGTCQHVWNYAHSVARIFPSLERDLRERIDFGTAWHEDGATDYRGECARHVAHDGQCGIILRAWREHQMCADDKFLRSKWPQIRKSIEYLIGQDGDQNGLLEGEQYNTLDASWWGPMAWISSFYVAALRAGTAMAEDMQDWRFAHRCHGIAVRGSKEIARQLYNGEYFIHKPDPSHPKATNTNDGCHIDQLMGQAWALQVGLPRVLPETETQSALEAIWKYNFTPDVGPYRDESVIKGGRWYAMAGEGGVIMTTFPRGGIDKAAGQGGFGFYFNEVWTGQEHQLAAHMLWEGMAEKALVITRVLHDRHHAARRNPYNEVECSDHYTRAMSSHGTFLAAGGYEYHGPKGHLGFAPKISPENFKTAFTAAEGWGTFSQVRTGGTQTDSITVRYGRLKLRTLAFELADKDSKVKIRKVSATLLGERLPAALDRGTVRAEVVFADEVEVKAGETLEITFS